VKVTSFAVVPGPAAQCFSARRLVTCSPQLSGLPGWADAYALKEYSQYLTLDMPADKFWTANEALRHFAGCIFLL
jgi:hypothetical protein